jgi:elongation factor 2
MASITRSLSIIAHVDHGKTTLSDSFLSRARVLSDDKAGTALTLDFGKEEQERGITITSLPV